MKPQTRMHFTLSLLTAGVLCASTATGRLTCQQEPSWQISRNWSGTTAVNPPRSTRIKSKAMSNSILSAIYSTGWSASLRQVKSSRAAEKWENKDNTVWTFHLRPGITRSDGTPSPRKILSGAGSDWSTRKPSLRMPAIPAVCVSSTALISQKAKAPESLGVKAINDTTLEVTLTQPNAAFPGDAGSPVSGADR